MTENNIEIKKPMNQNDERKEQSDMKKDTMNHQSKETNEQKSCRKE